MELYERLQELDADKAEVRASRILHRLGFSAPMQQKKLEDFSRGWRMRVALARASAFVVTGLLATAAPHLIIPFVLSCLLHTPGSYPLISTCINIPSGPRLCV
ncbi:hypothetical protein J4Q44_G00363060 [Coregonus suidteri]|uniref:Uncharacterized protein n=1 Tax=Coregonus suidteri TaxID=861788 RepID=A0AAN8Q6E3_9TELE